jgi:transcriptional regulator with XRE-family HTH domain
VDGESILDCDAIKLLRISRGMSQQELGLALGATEAAVRDLERGRNQNELQLRFLARLVDVLEVDLRDILRRDCDSADPAEDDMRVEALLSYERQPLSVPEIAATFGWTLPRTRQAIGQLRDRLATGGTRLRETSNGSWKVAPHHSVVSTSDRERLAKARLRKKGLNTTEALVLRQLAAGLVDQRWEDKAKRYELMAFGRLHDLGLVISNEHRDNVMASEVERSLHIAQQAPKVSVLDNQNSAGRDNGSPSTAAS